MPIFEFECAECGRAFEELVRHETAVACPACGSASVDRKLSLPARPATAGSPADVRRRGPPPGGGCCGGACGNQH